ncbi:MAG: HAD family phosphatase [Patescibacteria group bacterium]
MRTIRGIAFDLEGTLVNVEPAHHRAHLQIARELGLKLTLEQCLRGDVLPHFIGGPDEVIYQEMLELAGNPSGVTAAELLARKKTLYRENLRWATFQTRPGWNMVLVKALIQRLEVSIGSLTAKEEAQVLLNRSGLSKLFPRRHIILREDVTNPKPTPDVFLKTAERMGISPSAQLVFEDSPRGVQAALAAGSVAVGVPVYDRPEVHNALLQAGAFRTYRSWGEVALLELLAAAQSQA